MCGIAGIISIDKKEVTLERLKKMTDILHYRGPDGDRHWINSGQNAGLGHRRLSIIDLSHEADQPMHYLGRYTIVFNGEIYNYIELKEVLLKDGYRFTTSSDTEVLMALYDRDKERCLQLLDGMFSFVIYDDEKKEIFAARDRFGEKPFFYNYDPGKHFIFGSELKALWAAGISRTYHEKMMYNFLTYKLLDNPQDLSQTFFKDCLKLLPSHYLVVNAATCTISAIKRYWDIDPGIQDTVITPLQAEEKFRYLFKTSVIRRLRSDVAVGSSLSGGLDSSIVVWQIDDIYKSTASGAQKTFSARFPGYLKDESRYMQMIIDQTNVDPYFIYPDGKKMADDLDNLFYHQEEPFLGASIYAQYCVMKLAKQNNVTVLLDGQGADEVLAGYHSYYMEFFKELKKKYPALYKNEYTSYKHLQNSNVVNKPIKKDFKFLLKTFAPSTLEPIKKIGARNRQLLNSFLDKNFYNENRKNHFRLVKQYDQLNLALYDSTMHGGLQQLLRNADRNSMAHSREVRLPFLSHELVTFIFSLPSYFKIQKGWTKWILRETYKNVLPQKICWRTDKVGFEPPQTEWMKNKHIVEKIHESKKKLLVEAIINKKFIDTELSPADAWPVLMAGYLINNR
jgi:asparagine synthase (glutamine-hydrolysing)